MWKQVTGIVTRHPWILQNQSPENRDIFSHNLITFKKFNIHQYYLMSSPYSKFPNFLSNILYLSVFLCLPWSRLHWRSHTGYGFHVSFSFNLEPFPRPPLLFVCLFVKVLLRSVCVGCLSWCWHFVESRSTALWNVPRSTVCLLVSS